MGKVLLERMLSLLPDIAVVYVLVRPKARAGATAISIDERLKQEVFESQIFEPLKDRMGDAFDGLFDSKVHAVSGDVAMDGLGLDPAIYKRLQGEVDIIIHCAAVVSFDAPLDTAVRLNTLGPGRMVEFAKGCKDPFFAQVSTCYVNATRKGLWRRSCRIRPVLSGTSTAFPRQTTMWNRRLRRFWRRRGR